MTVRAPEHLQPATAEWWTATVAAYELEPHHLKLLSLAAETWDRYEQARCAVSELGTTFTDRFGSPKIRPEVIVERDTRLAFARLLREVGLEDEPSPGLLPSRRA